MKIISIINLKGGVAKTISSANIAHILSSVHQKKVLIVDNDKQGNISKIYKRHSYERAGTAELMTKRNIKTMELIQKTEHDNLDIITANMNLLKANLEVMMDQGRQQQSRFKAALEQVKENYDYCIIDNAPDMNISTINALVASDGVLIPIKIDDFAFDGITELIEQIEITKEDFNPNLKLMGCFVTQYVKNDVNVQGEEWLQQREDIKLFETHIRRTHKVDESTFAKMPILEYSKTCGAAKDYVKLTEEILSKEI